MISKKSLKFCSEPIELIENYEEALNDNTQIWVCHHRKEIELHLSMIELIKCDLYFNQPASDLIFLTKSEHSRIHALEKNIGQYQKGHTPWNKGKKHSEETKQKMREKALGKKQSEESNKKRSEKMKGRNSPMKGKTHTEEARKKISNANRGNKNHAYKYISPETIYYYRVEQKLSWEKIKNILHFSTKTLQRHFKEYMNSFTLQ